MPLDSRASVEENAAEIVRLPDGTDFARGEHGQLLALLVGKPEERDPEKYARIFAAVRHDSTATPWMRFAAWSESINGRRRMRGADMPALSNELDHLVRQASAELENDDAKYLLLGGVLWNVALVRRGLRRYKDEAAAQLKSSAWYGLAGDVPKQLTGIFAAQVGEVTAAFVEGNSAQIARSIQAMAVARNHVALAPFQYPLWMHDNASLHIGWPVAMTEIAYPGLLNPADYLLDFVTGQSSRFEQWAQMFKLRDLFTRGEYQAIAGTTPVELSSSSADNARLTAQIYIALAERKLGEIERAAARLRAVADHSGLDGGIPIAIAKRLLAA